MLTSFVERDGMARTVLLMLGMTTIACLSYTWGYSEVGSALNNEDLPVW